MDQTLLAKIDPTTGDKFKLRIKPAEQAVEILTNDQEPGELYSVKPLKELYGSGTGSGSVDFTDETFYPLLLAIEESFLHAIRRREVNSDAAIIAALDRLCISPDGDVSGDSTTFALQFDLRVALSVNNYSRDDVRHTLKKVRQSAIRHNKLVGPQGYVMFILKQLGGKG